MLRAFALAFAQLGDWRVLSILSKSIAITLALFAALGGMLWWGVDAWAPQEGNAGWITALLAGLAFVASVWMLFRFVAMAVLQFFGDEVVRAVEAEHYPQAAAAARPLGWRREVQVGLAALLRALGYNLLALPPALLLAPTGVGPALVFGAVNALLLGRELTEMVALRHRDASGAPPLPGLATRAALGGVIVILLTLPLINLVAPVLGAAAATHLVHRRRNA